MALSPTALARRRPATRPRSWRYIEPGRNRRRCGTRPPAPGSTSPKRSGRRATRRGPQLEQLVGVAGAGDVDRAALAVDDEARRVRHAQARSRDAAIGGAQRDDEVLVLTCHQQRNVELVEHAREASSCSTARRAGSNARVGRQGQHLLGVAQGDVVWLGRPASRSGVRHERRRRRTPRRTCRRRSAPSSSTRRRAGGPTSRGTRSAAGRCGGRREPLEIEEVTGLGELEQGPNDRGKTFGVPLMSQLARPNRARASRL